MISRLFEVILEEVIIHIEFGVVQYYRLVINPFFKTSLIVLMVSPSEVRFHLFHVNYFVS